MRLKTFSPSTYKTLQLCELKAKFQHVDHLCPLCYKGTTKKDELTGVYACNACGASEVKGPALQRGTDYDKAITQFIQLGGEAPAALPEIVNKTAQAAIINLAKAFPTGKVKTQEKICLDAEWNLSPEAGRSITLYLDLLYLDEEAGYAQILDWKTGSLTKTGKLRSGAVAGYIDQLECYALGVLAKYPKINHVDTALYFLDIDIGRSDCLSYGRGENYEHVKKRWMKIVFDALSKESFVPSFGFWCKAFNCGYRKELGGPCVF